MSSLYFRGLELGFIALVQDNHALHFIAAIAAILCHRLSLLSLRLTSRTISSIWNGCKRVGSFSSFARHSIKILSDPCSS